MLIKKCKTPDISDLKPTAVGYFLVGCLVGEDKKRTTELKKYVTVVARLIDKAKNEYLMAREAVIAEEDEGNLSYDEIIKRGEGQFLYTCTIINHFENCINAISRIYKILKCMPKKYNFNHQRKITDIRNAIEHMDERILNNIEGSTSLNVSENALIIEVVGESIKIDDLADEIRILHKDILHFISKDSLVKDLAE